MSQLTKAASEMAQQAQQMAGGAAAGLKDSKPVPPVSFKKLIDYLPKDLEGTKADEPEEVNDGEEGAAKQVMDRIDLKGLAKGSGS